MRIEHIAIWTHDIEAMKDFYQTYFKATANAKYSNPEKGFSSYFLTFASGARLEVMHKPNIAPYPGERGGMMGYTHLAFSVGSQAQVEALTMRLKADGNTILDGPRWTGDGYYESKILDCDGNVVEITI